MKRSSFDIAPVPPFRLDLTVWTLRRRADNLVDRWDGEVYRRILVDDEGQPFEIAVRQVADDDAPRIAVSLSDRKSAREIERNIAPAVTRLLGIDRSLDDFYRLAAREARLRPLASQFRGAKPPRFPHGFEALVNAISCQQLSLTVGIRLLNNLAQAFGATLTTDAGVFHAFPRPQDLAEVDIETLRGMKFSYQKARYIVALAQSLVEGRFDLDEIDTLDDEQAVERLCGVKGVGRWTAEYFLLRGLGRTHVFPADDVGARNNLERLVEAPEKLNYGGVHEVLEPWKGYGGLIYFHLLLKSLSEKAVIAN